jgi:protein Tex
MNEQHLQHLAKELQLDQPAVAAVAQLLADGATVPFIARYRKERSGGMDEVQIATIRDGLERLAALDKRRANMLLSLRERELLTPELQRALANANNLTELEDIYLPYRVKRRTRAQTAREAGLQPLADELLAQKSNQIDVAAFINETVDNEDAVLAGARDIIAEQVSENSQLRGELREQFQQYGQLTASVVKKKADSPEAARFRDWFDWSEPVARAPSHRILALLRGVEQGILRVQARPDTERTTARIRRKFVHGRGFAADQVGLACDDAYQRLLQPALENETLGQLKKQADEEAIAIFRDNLRQLLLAAPLGRNRVLAIDPGLRTGCKLVVLDEQGDLQQHDVLHLVKGAAASQQAASRVRQLVQQFDIQAIGIGNGTAGRETESFVRDLDLGLPVVLVDESGASVYSASAIAREEFPDHDITVRGAVSIGRRLQDPLAELVKLDPKVIGVGQYQHDVDQAALGRALDDCIEACVNQVGVELNSASTALLTAVAGLGPKLAAAIVAYRSEHGAFRSRRQLLKVPRLGAKAFEQCAGFLRIADGKHPLDGTAVHPERYDLIERMAADQDCDLSTLIRDHGIRLRIPLQRYCAADIGLPTLQDIFAELEKPGRDPRPRFAAFSFADVHSIDDLEEGMRLPGIITNITGFGAFVDVGVHQDGLVHISQLADRFVRDPAEVVSLRQQVQVRVMSIDRERRRIALSMRE